MFKKDLIKNTKEYLIKERFALVIFLCSFVIISSLTLGKCTIYNTTVFDSQAFLAWDYLALKHYMPYKDVFYPYGILYYFKDSSLFFSIIYIALLSVLFTSFYKFFIHILQNKLTTFAVFTSFVFFVIRYAGFESFGRYGIFLAFIVYYSILFSKNLYLKKKIAFILGALNGIIFYLLFDQIIYASIFLTGFILVAPITRFGISICKNVSYYKKAINTVSLYVLGFLFGFIPFSFFAIINGFFNEFFDNLVKMKDLFFYAKTPFFPGSHSPENLFTFLILFISIFYLEYKIFSKQKHFTTSTCSIVSIVFVLLFLEQKNIVRSNAGQLTFIAFVLLLLVLFEICKVIKGKFFLKVISISIIFGGILIFLPGRNFEHTLRSTGKRGTCIEESKIKIVSYDKDLKSVLQFLDNTKKNNEDVYGFPGSPFFYVYYNSKFPYYPSTYEASPLYGQESRINFLNQKTNMFVVFDMSQWGIQDGVPEYARAQKEFKYIFTHFRVIKKIGNYIVLYRNENLDNFKSINIKENINLLNKNLLNIFLSAIPESEGRYKAKYLHREKPLITSDSLVKINQFLEERQIPGENIIIEITSKISNQPGQKVLIIQNVDGKTSRVLFSIMKNRGIAIVRLSNLPMFYGNSVIKKIEYSDNSAQYSLYTYSVDINKYLW